MEILSNVSIVLFVIVVLIAITNIITEVFKSLITGTIARRVLTIIVAIVVTYLAMGVYALINPITVWFIWFPGGVIAGIIIAYGAMYGYDQLYANLLDKIFHITGGDD